jgi:hypothetical protein
LGQQLLSTRLAEVHRNRPLALVESSPEQALFSIQRNGPTFVVETSTDLVEADDICTQLGQCHAAERCCHEGRAFDDAETF